MSRRLLDPKAVWNKFGDASYEVHTPLDWQLPIHPIVPTLRCIIACWECGAVLCSRRLFRTLWERLGYLYYYYGTRTDPSFQVLYIYVHTRRTYRSHVPAPPADMYRMYVQTEQESCTYIRSRGGRNSEFAPVPSSTIQDTCTVRRSIAINYHGPLTISAVSAEYFLFVSDPCSCCTGFFCYLSFSVFICLRPVGEINLAVRCGMYVLVVMCPFVVCRCTEHAGDGRLPLLLIMLLVYVVSLYL